MIRVVVDENMDLTCHEQCVGFGIPDFAVKRKKVQNAGCGFGADLQPLADSKARCVEMDLPCTDEKAALWEGSSWNAADQEAGMRRNALRHVFDSDPYGDVILRLTQKNVIGADRALAGGALRAVREHAIEQNHGSGVRDQFRNRRKVRVWSHGHWGFAFGSALAEMGAVAGTVSQYSMKLYHWYGAR